MMYFILTFFLGSVVGSFINVLIDRSIAGEDWVHGRSHCDHCQKPLAWYDMVPILSFLLYRAKSRCCQKRLSWRYPIVELIVGTLFLWWLIVGFVFFQLASAPLVIVQPLFWLITGILLLILALSDSFYRVVIMPIVWLGIGITALYRLVLWNSGVFNSGDLGKAVLLALGFYGFFWLLYKLTKGRGMGDGDMYIGMYMGLLLGWPRGMVALLSSFVLGAVVGVGLMVSGLRTRKDALPFVPFMVVGIVVGLLWGQDIWMALYG